MIYAWMQSQLFEESVMKIAILNANEWVSVKFYVD